MESGSAVAWTWGGEGGKGPRGYQEAFRGDGNVPYPD